MTLNRFARGDKQMGVEGLLAVMKSPAERIRLRLSTAATAESDAARVRDGTFEYSELQAADAAIQREAQQRHISLMVANEAGRVAKNHEAEMKARAARLERYAAENGG